MTTSSRLVARGLAFAACTLFAISAPAQNAWRPLDVATPPDGPLAYDAGRGCVVLFGADAQARAVTWEWSSRWTQRQPSTSPSPRDGHGLVFDAARGVTVLFGGADRATGNLHDDTWIWDGSGWTRRAPATRPSARQRPAVAYDRRNQRVVLFGGLDGGGNPLDDTWQWDGVTWTRVTTMVSPPPMREAVLGSTDPLVLFGNDSTYTSQTWTWDGSAWTRQTPTGSPGGSLPIIGNSIAYDAVRDIAVLVGWKGPAGTNVWEWDGSEWTYRTRISPWRIGHSVVFHAGIGRVFLYGGVPPIPPADAIARDVLTWNLSGNASWDRFLPAQFPPPMADHVSVYDEARAETLVFGPNGDETWTLKGREWTHHQLSLHPSARSDAALAYDPVRGRAVLFGGLAGSTALADTWEWDGVNWTQRFPVRAPAARYGHAMTFDAARGVVVMAGGTPCDSWSWDGNRWTSLGAATCGDELAMTYDAFRERVVAISVNTLFPPRFHIYEWNGREWSHVHSNFSAITDVAMAYDPAERLVFYYGPSGPLSNLVAFPPGVDLVPAHSPAGRLDATFHFDGSEGRALLLGGRDPTTGFLHPVEPMLYDPGDLSLLYRFGRACGPTVGPRFEIWHDGTLPRLGAMMQFRGLYAPLGAQIIGTLGFSIARMGAFDLPLGLTSVGATGCSLYVRTDVQMAAPSGWSIRIPNDATLLDRSFFVQLAALAPGVNPLGLLMSDAVAARVGSD